MDKLERMADELAENWRHNLTLSGRNAFLENERKRKELFAEAERLGILDAVRARATDIMNGYR